ncbi:hypothetical protein JB92DRAFT_2140028 [Gautieria morchelliformis]|nr:hypothetical protein JB92DRAFT_2140028 [Gautieria morchelliformis]
MVMMLLCILGYIILLCNVSPAAKFAAVFITVAGATPSIPTAITFVGNKYVRQLSLCMEINIKCSFGPMYTRATVMGVSFSMATAAGIISANVYPIGDAPRYIRYSTRVLVFVHCAMCLDDLL